MRSISIGAVVFVILVIFQFCWSIKLEDEKEIARIYMEIVKVQKQTIAELQGSIGLQGVLIDSLKSQLKLCQETE